MELSYQEEQEIDQVLDSAEQKIFSISRQHLTSNFLPIDSLLTDAFNRIDELHKQSDLDKYVSRGYPAQVLTHHWREWLNEKEYTTSVCTTLLSRWGTEIYSLLYGW